MAGGFKGIEATLFFAHNGVSLKRLKVNIMAFDLQWLQQQFGLLTNKIKDARRYL